MTKVRTLCIIGNGSSEEIHVEFLNTASLEPIDVIKKINKLLKKNKPGFCVIKHLDTFLLPDVDISKKTTNEVIPSTDSIHTYQELEKLIIQKRKELNALIDKMYAEF